MVSVPQGEAFLEKTPFLLGSAQIGRGGGAVGTQIDFDTKNEKKLPKFVCRGPPPVPKSMFILSQK